MKSYRRGKSSESQLLNLTPHIKDGFQKKLITGTVFVNLSTVYDTVNHNRLVKKIYDLSKDFTFTKVVRNLLESRMFYVSHQGKNSRWRNQRNDLQQGSVLAPTLYNIYVNDQRISKNTKDFLYANDLAITAQGETHSDVQDKLQSAVN